MALAVSTLGTVLIAWAGLLILLLAWLSARGRRLSIDADGQWADGDFDERRGPTDRRRVDKGPPPGARERRAGFDRRAGWVGATPSGPGD